MKEIVVLVENDGDGNGICRRMIRSRPRDNKGWK